MLKFVKGLFKSRVTKEQERIAELEAKLQQSDHLVDHAVKSINVLHGNVDAMTYAFGDLMRKVEADHADQNLVIACLLANAGFEVVLDQKFIQSIRESDLVIDYVNTPDVSTISLLTAEEAERRRQIDEAEESDEYVEMETPPDAEEMAAEECDGQCGQYGCDCPGEDRASQ